MADIRFASFNLYNLQEAGAPFRGKRYTPEEYRAKIDWSAARIAEMRPDVIAFQELWSPQCLRDIFAAPALADRYELAFIRDSGWYDIAVAAAVRRPWTIRGKEMIKDFPPDFRLIKREVDRAQTGGEDQDDDIEVRISKFSRALLKLSVAHADKPALPAIEVFVAHLKSKLPTRLDSEEWRNDAIKPHATALGAAISTLRRTAEAAAARWLLNERMRDTDVPVVVLGDYNDSPNSNTLAIVTAQPSFRFYADSRAGWTSDRGLYVAGALQQLRSFRDVTYTHIYKGEYDSLDHILVSEQFYDYAQKRVWSFREMKVWNDHLGEDPPPGATDHGLVCAQFDYNPAD